MSEKANPRSLKSTEPRMKDGEKKCGRCQLVKPLSEFYDKCSYCKDCKNASSKQYHAGNREKILEHKRMKYSENPVPTLQRGKLYYVVNRIKVLARCAIHKKENKEQYAQYTRERRFSLDYEFESWQWDALCQHYGNKCLRCGSSNKLTADHVVPVAKGGSGGIINIQPLCQPCNSRKHVKTIDYRPDKGVFAATLEAK